ncbi:MAG: anaerobic sulfite reductase subunit AsrA [Anaerovoracaceae bacterium]|jgi:anaerobic sulfite reductase subunit A
MSYTADACKMNEILSRMEKEYRIYAPRKYAQSGTDDRGYVIRYGEVSTMGKIVFDEKSDFSPKEVFYPIMQVLLRFENETCVESELEDERKLLIFARPCDVNGMERLDSIFLKNGGKADNFYKRLREKVRIVLMECSEEWDSCFCVSMGASKTENYAAAIKQEGETYKVSVKDNELESYFSHLPRDNYTYAFVEKNKKEVSVPNITDRSQIKNIIDLPMWKEFDDKCIACGGCGAVCISCSCFDTIDIIFDETSLEGERRRKWSSCMLSDYSTMAGGHGVRETPGQRMRFKTLHKIYDFKYRFGEENMCVGCGRCDERCSREISFSDIINDLSEEVEKMNACHMSQREDDPND